MKTNTQTTLKTGAQVRVPQMVVRCDVRAGDDLATCQLQPSQTASAT